MGTKAYRRILLKYLEELDKLIDERVLKRGELRMKESEVQAIKETKKRLKESELQQQESLVTESTTLEANVSTKGTALEASLVNKGIALNDNTGVTKNSRTESERSNIETTKTTETSFNSSEDENRSYDKEISSSEGYDAIADIGPFYDSDTMSEVPHDMFKNVFSHGIQSHKQPESSPDTYEVNENNSNIFSDIPNMDQDKDMEGHDDVAYDQL
nr:hypothetical protein [Tanacetum cinerariifolium]